MTDPDMTPLFEASLDQIVVELQRRFDKTLYAFETASLGDDTRNEIFTSFSGGRAAAIGLCELAKARLIQGDEPIPYEDDDDIGPENDHGHR